MHIQNLLEIWKLKVSKKWQTFHLADGERNKNAEISSPLSLYWDLKLINTNELDIAPVWKKGFLESMSGESFGLNQCVLLLCHAQASISLTTSMSSLHQKARTQNHLEPKTEDCL